MLVGVVGLLQLAGPAGASAAPCRGEKLAEYTAVGEHEYEVPSGVQRVCVEAVGGPGQGVKGVLHVEERPFLGGHPGIVEGDFPVTPGSMLHTFVNGGGGRPGNSSSMDNYAEEGRFVGGAGGGASAVWTGSELLAVAGGGGGTGGYVYANGRHNGGYYFPSAGGDGGPVGTAGLKSPGNLATAGVGQGGNDGNGGDGGNGGVVHVPGGMGGTSGRGGNGGLTGPETEPGMTIPQGGGGGGVGAGGGGGADGPWKYSEPPFVEKRGENGGDSGTGTGEPGGGGHGGDGGHGGRTFANNDGGGGLTSASGIPIFAGGGGGGGRDWEESEWYGGGGGAGYGAGGGGAGGGKNAAGSEFIGGGGGGGANYVATDAKHVTNDTEMDMSKQEARVKIYAYVPQPEVEMKPEKAEFQPTEIGKRTAPQKLTITNSGDAALTIEEWKFDGSGEDFEIDGTGCGVSEVGHQDGWHHGVLDPGKSCPIEVTFAPRSVGVKAPTLHVVTDAGERSASLHGEGIPVARPEPVLTPHEHDFKTVAVDTTSEPETFKLENAGNAPLSLEAPVIDPPDSGAFAIHNHCGTTLAESSSCTIEVSFSPTSEKLYEAELQIRSDGSRVAGSMLSGRGEGAHATLTPPSHEFDEEEVGSTTAPFPFTLTNTSKVATLPVEGVDIEPSGDKDFGLVPGDCGKTLGPETSCSIGVTFSPQSVGPKEATLVVHAGGEPLKRGLTGRGTEKAFGEVVVEPETYEFPVPQEVGDGPGAAKKFTLHNVGGIPVEVKRVFLGGERAQFAITDQSECREKVIPAGSKCSVEVAFDPIAEGHKQATLEVETGAPTDVVKNARISGNGVVAEPAIEPSEGHDFEEEEVGTVSRPFVFEVRNGGDLPLEILSKPMFGGPDRNEFGFEGESSCDQLPLTLAKGQSCTVSVVFEPHQLGERHAKLQVSTSAGILEVALDGTGLKARQSAEPEESEFGGLFEG